MTGGPGPEPMDLSGADYAPDTVLVDPTLTRSCWPQPRWAI